MCYDYNTEYFKSYMTVIFDGKKFAHHLENELREKADGLRKKGVVPKMVSILADNSPESSLYVSLKEKFAQRIGVGFEIHRFLEAEENQTERVIEDIKKANNNPLIQGIMIQLPAPNSEKIISAIAPEKDIDCLTPENLGLVLEGRPRFLPATVKAVLEIIKRIDGFMSEDEEKKFLAGRDICIVGASIIVGKPLAIILSDFGGTVTLCRSTTRSLVEYTKRADILISATGSPELISGQMIKNGAAVIDVGISKLLREGKYRVVGDVAKTAYEVASFLTPVPGGVGPVTVACLFENLLDNIIARQG